MILVETRWAAPIQEPGKSSHTRTPEEFSFGQASSTFPLAAASTFHRKLPAIRGKSEAGILRTDPLVRGGRLGAGHLGGVAVLGVRHGRGNAPCRRLDDGDGVVGLVLGPAEGDGEDPRFVVRTESVLPSLWRLADAMLSGLLSVSESLQTAEPLGKGPAGGHARGRGGRILVVADDGGIELIRPRGAFSFGLIPWSLVHEVRLEELSGPLASRPKLVFEIHGNATPFQDRFELLPEGKDERSHAAQSLEAILAKRRAIHP